MSLVINKSYAWQYDANQAVIGIALVLSLILHFAVMRALPWLETVKAMPPLTITAELQTALPPPKPEPPAQTKPEDTKPVDQPKPEPLEKPKALQKEKPPKPVPVLATQAEPESKEYTVPVVPQTATPSEPADPVAPSVSTPTEPTESAASPNKNAATTSTSTHEISSEDAWNGFGQALYDMVNKNKNYPQIAVRRNWEGDVKVLVKFVSGNLVDVTLVNSSGHKVLDDEALAMVRKSANLLPIKGALAKASFSITVPVDFKLAE